METAAETPPPAPPADPGVPPSIPGYELLGELGRGAMGVVYKAHHLKLNRIVALKMVLAGSHAGPAEVLRFLREAEAAARLQHPHIVQIHEIGQHAGLPYFTLEYAGGGSLAKKLAHQPQPPVEAARLTKQLAEAMQHAHQQGVVHRDLKPANVLLTDDGAPKVTDFGLAKTLKGGDGLTQTGAILGTPSYMAPEQARGNVREIGPAADVYALGAILYEMLTGRPPFQGPTMHDTLLQVMGDDPVPVRRLQPKTPRDLETICLKCLHKEPGRRYPSAQALADELQRFLNGEPILARPVAWSERMVKWARRRPMIAALLALIVLVSGAGLGAVLWQLRQTDLARREADGNAQAYKTASETAERALGEKTIALEKEKTARKDKQSHLYVAHMNLVQRHWERGDLAAALNLLRQHIPKPGEDDNRGFEWFYYWRMLHAEVHTLKDLPGAVRSLAFSPKANLLAIACRVQDAPGELLLWDADARGKPQLLSREPQPSSPSLSAPTARRWPSLPPRWVSPGW
jgi:hypothetical protein